MGVSNLLQLSSPRLISDDYTPTDEVVSLPPLQLILAAWWEGWKRPSTKFQTQLNKTRVSPHPSHQVTILAAWWEGWKESTTPQLFSCSSLTLLFYLLLLYYMLSKSLLYSVPPAVCDLTNPYDLLSPHHYPIPTGSMGGWVKVPDHYSSIPRAPPWQHRTGSWPIQHSTTILQLMQLNIRKILRHFISTTYSPNQPHTPRVTMQTTVFQDPVRIFNPG